MGQVSAMHTVKKLQVGCGTLSCSLKIASLEISPALTVETKQQAEQLKVQVQVNVWPGLQ